MNSPTTRVSRIYRRILKGVRSLPWPQCPALRKPVVACAGGITIAVGILMIVLPGPATIIIPFGLAILAMEFVCVRRWLRRSRRSLRPGVRVAPTGGSGPL